MGDPPTWGSFFDAWELFRNPTLAATFAGALLGFLGVYVVLRRMVFLSAALSQCAGFGVTLAFYAQLHLGIAATIATPAAGATLATLLASLAPLADRSELATRRDSLLGLTFLLGSAGTLIVGTRIVQEIQDIQSILFGSAVVVLDHQLTMIIVLCVVVLTLHIWWMRGFIQVSFDRWGAKVRGLPVNLLDIVLLLTLAISISLCTLVLGALPVFAFSVLPAMAAIRLTSNIPRALALAAIFGALSGFGGYLLAFYYDLPVGASQTAVAAAFALAAEMLRPLLFFFRRHHTKDGIVVTDRS